MKRWTGALLQTSLFQLRELYRNKIAFFFNLVFPLLLVVLFATLFRTPDSTVTTAVGVVRDDDGASFALETALQAPGTFTVRTGSLAELEEALHAGHVRAVVTVPVADPVAEDAVVRPASAATTRDIPGVVDIVFNPLSPASSRAASQLRSVIDRVGMQLSGAQPIFVARMLSLDGVQRRDVFDYLMPGQMTIMLLSAALFTVGSNIAVQRQTGAMRHLFSTPLPVAVWAFGRVSANLLMSFIQAVILFAFAGALYGVAPPANLAGTTVTIAVCTLASLGMGIVIGSLAKGEEGALAITMPFYMALIFFGNATVPLEDTPAVVKAILPFVPSFHMTEALRAVMREGLPLASVANELLILSAISAITLTVGLWRIRRQFIIV